MLDPGAVGTPQAVSLRFPRNRDAEFLALASVVAAVPGTFRAYIFWWHSKGFQICFDKHTMIFQSLGLAPMDPARFYMKFAQVSGLDL